MALKASLAAPPPLGGDRQPVGLASQVSSLCYGVCACVLLFSRVSPFLVGNMLAIFVSSLYYRWLMHDSAPRAWMSAHFPLAKKLDGLFIMHMSLAWGTGLPYAGFGAACLITFVLGDGDKLRGLVFGTSMLSTCTSLYRFGQFTWLVGYLACCALGVGAFVCSRERWTVSRLWAWHGCTAMAFGLSVVGMVNADAESRGYPLRGFLYLGTALYGPSAPQCAASEGAGSGRVHVQRLAEAWSLRQPALEMYGLVWYPKRGA
jgi:hypothetical protein